MRPIRVYISLNIMKIIERGFTLTKRILTGFLLSPFGR